MAKYQPAYMKTPSAPKMQTFVFENGNNGGMNTRLQADQIRIDQSPKMLNMNYREGVPSNRYGFDKVNATSWGATAIRGIIEHRPVSGTNTLLAIHGGKILILEGI